MPSLAVSCLPLAALLTILQVTASSQASGSSQPQSTLDLLRRKRALDAVVRGPRRAFFPESMSESRMKREGEEQWVWMPAYGYMPIPEDEIIEKEEDRPNRLGTLLRYG